VSDEQAKRIRQQDAELIGIGRCCAAIVRDLRAAGHDEMARRFSAQVEASRWTIAEVERELAEVEQLRARAAVAEAALADAMARIKYADAPWSGEGVSPCLDDHKDARRDAEHLLEHGTSPLGGSAVARNLARCYLDLREGGCVVDHQRRAQHVVDRRELHQLLSGSAEARARVAARLGFGGTR
jgi:hypothetical protein